MQNGNTVGAPPCAHALLESASRIEAIASEIVGSARMRLVDEVVTLRRLARANAAPPDPILTAAAERKQIVERQAEEPRRRQRSRSRR